MPARIKLACGARACEALVLQDLADLHAEAAGDPTILRQPIRIIVPSTTLRQHLCTRIVAKAGRAVAGVVVHTLHGFARFVLDGAGIAAPSGADLFPLIVRQVAEDEASLALLRDLTDGYTSLVGSIADLLDAGFEEAHADAIDELLQHVPASDPLRDRARAVVRVAERTVSTMNRYGIARQSAAFTMAREIMERTPTAVRARAVLIHGFADATGVASDFIASLLRHDDARVYLDHPADPATDDGGPAGIGFVQRFTERMSGLGTVDDAASRGALVAPKMLRAHGAEGEVRAVADRIRILLDAGTPPEGIGVVARSIASYAVPLRQHFGRLGVPFSAPGVRGPFTPLQRRIAALLTILQEQDSAAAERWLDAMEHPPFGLEGQPSWRADLRYALHTINAARIADVAAFVSATDQPSASKQVASARRLLTAHNIAAAAADLQRRWQSWPKHAVFGDHRHHFGELIQTGLGWSSAAAQEWLASSVDRLASEIPQGMRLTYDDFRALLASALEQVGGTELGGNGAGVQVLDVTAARGLTFQHLFVVGLNRDVFPRTISEDPLVPDVVRRGLTALLPDLPIKQSGFEEERYLFAQLLSASPQVTLSWQFAADDGSAVSCSPLVERLRLNHRTLEVETVPGLYAPPTARAEEPTNTDLPLLARIIAKPKVLRPAHEHAVLAGLYGDRENVAAAFRVAFPQIDSSLPPIDAARIQLGVIDEHEGKGGEGLGPYYGLVGPIRSTTDPRNAKLYITTIERVARCPWRTFVAKLLGIQPPPDALEALPAVTALVLGNIVHRVLDRIVRDAIPNAPPTLAIAGGHAPTLVAWPADAVVDAMLQEEAGALAEESGVALPGLVRLMVRHARAYLEKAKRHDWARPDSAVAIVGSEMTGAVQVAHEGTLRTVHFTADRVDSMPSGLRLTDYKTGKPMRASALSGNIANGTHLQCVAYALGAGHPHDQGRYLYLKPDADEAKRAIDVPASDAELVQCFHTAAGTVLDVWDRGTFFPRFAEPSGSELGDCRFCEVRDACLRNDSGYRDRFMEWAAEAAHDDQLPEASRAVMRGWRMRAKADRAAKVNE